MSVFDLFRGFFGLPGGHFRGRRDPFFDAMTHDEDDDDDDEDDGFYYDGIRGDQQDPFDSAWRFGFSLGPDGMRLHEPPVFGHVLREMEEVFSQLGRWDGQPESGHSGVPSIMPPPLPHPPAERGGGGGGGGSSRNPLRDFMLKSPDNDPRGPQAGPPRAPRGDGHPSYESPEYPRSPFGWTPFSKFNDIWKREPQKTPEEERKEDRDLDSAVSSGGLDQILTPRVDPAPNQPRVHSSFQSVVVTKVVKPDGTVEERRTVRDGRGNVETTVSRSGGPGSLEGPDRHTGPDMSGQNPFSDMRDDDSLFSKFFGGFK